MFVIVCDGRHQCILQLLRSSKNGVFLFSNFADVRYSVFEIRLRVRLVQVYMAH
jgi:hypothetical protein